MEDRDEMLRDLLRKWETPAVPPTLDTRVRAALRGRPARTRSNVWIPIVAAAAGIVIVSGLWTRGPREIEMDSERIVTETDVTSVTTMQLSGFAPIPDGKLRVEEASQ
jgi:hypothetical protein